MQYLDAITKKTEGSLFISKANYSISQWSKPVLQPVNTEEAEVEWFYKDLQDLLEQYSKKMSFSL